MSKLGQTLTTFVHRHKLFQIPCRYRRGLVRNVIDSFENEEEYKKHLESKKIIKNSPKKVKKKPEVEGEFPSYEEFNKYSDVPGEILALKYEKPNPARIGTFSSMMLNMKSRSYRERHGCCMLEGKYLISDAMKTGMFLRLVYFSRLQNLVGLPIDVLRKTNLVKIGFREIQQASEVKIQTEGLLAIATKQDDITRKKLVEQRKKEMVKNGETLLPVTLICDNVRDSGNMGTLLRAAVAAGCEQVLTTKGCVDIWESKVIRAGAGAHFKIPILGSLDWDEIPDHLGRHNVQDVFLSHPNSESLKMSEILPNLKNITEKNNLHKKLTQDTDNLRIEDDDSDITKHFKDVVFRSQPYYDVTFIGNGHTVVVMGGEVHGVSADACLYALENSLQNYPTVKILNNLVNIPMSSGSECLNTAVAGSILLFEARRQFLDE